MKKDITEADVESIDKVVRDNYEIYKTDETWIAMDGIVDLISYNKAEYRILWVLKEVNEITEGQDNCAYGDRNLRDEIKNLKDGTKIRSGYAKTFKPIIYTTFGVLKDWVYDGMDDIEKNPDMIDILKNIAYINIKKEPGGPVVDGAKLIEKYNRDKSVILHQIEKLAPDIIIFGNTLSYLKDGLDLKEENARQLNNLNVQMDNFYMRLNYPKFYLENDKIYINAYHPSFRAKHRRDKEKYVDGIIHAIRAWKEMKSK